MPAVLMDGVAVADALLQSVAAHAADVFRDIGRRPCLATVVMGDDPASHTYVRMKARRCADVGIESRQHALESDADTATVMGLVQELSETPTIDGILVQHPLPSHVDEHAVFAAIAAAKDVDGVTPASFASMALGGDGFASCTPAGIIRLLDAYEVPIAGRHAVIVGRSPILGRPAAMMLLRRDATITVCHSRTTDLESHVRQADILVAAVGRPRFIPGEWIRPGAVVIDAGYNPGNVGDVDTEAAMDRAGLLTPVPGGVGPLTIAVLLEQTVRAALAARRAQPPR